jgi:hypothetical protein
MAPVPTICRTIAALVLMLAANAASAPLGQDDEHPFVMPGTPAKSVPAPTPWFTGAQLMRQLERHDAGAAAYLKGVYDATESGLWCYTDRRHVKLRKQSPEAMRADAVSYLRRQPAAKLDGRAAVLIVQMWQARWPCPPDGCCT